MWPQLRMRQLAPWFIFSLWFLGITLLLSGLIRAGTLPVDYASYAKAATTIAEGRDPYQSPNASQQIWLTYHALETRLLQGDPSVKNAPFLPGPYLYPPTLALLLHDLQINAMGFVFMLLLTIYGFGALWLHCTGQSAWWLLWIVGSWDVIASFTGGNVELSLLFAILLASWLLWRQQAFWAAPLLALVVLVKPFYAFFFITFGLLLLVQPMTKPKHAFRTLTMASAGALLLLGLEVIRWPSALRTETLAYLRNAFAYQWFILPVDQQTPMSIWNRTPLQGLINAGMVPDLAKWVALWLWLLFLLITLWYGRKRRLAFPQAFALAFVLLYWGRPVGWGLIYLEIVVLLASWPRLDRQPRRLLFAGMLALAASHWVALVITLQGHWIRLFTLQSANFPWETWLVVPLCWAILLATLPRKEASTAE
ncbi:MAG: hypothetical protein U0350_43635 [Caldilineaceae bacterium]